MVERAERSCERCGRTIQWRAKWARTWDEVKYCSDGCRKRRLTATDLSLEVAIADLLDARPRDSSICPSEAARRLVQRGLVEITQGGKVVDPSRAKGPIRIRRPRR